MISKKCLMFLVVLIVLFANSVCLGESSNETMGLTVDLYVSYFNENSTGIFVLKPDSQDNSYILSPANPSKSEKVDATLYFGLDNDGYISTIDITGDRCTAMEEMGCRYAFSALYPEWTISESTDHFESLTNSVLGIATATYNGIEHYYRVFDDFYIYTIVVGEDYNGYRRMLSNAVMSEAEAKLVFIEVNNEFVDLTGSLSNLIDYWNDTEFTTLEQIHTYESMWQALSDSAKASQEKLVNNIPPAKYTTNWNKFAEYMGQLSTVLAKGSNMNTNGDDQYTGDEMVELIRTAGNEIVLIAEATITLTSELEQQFETENLTTSTPTATPEPTTTPRPTATPKPQPTCTVDGCSYAGTKSYINPFSGSKEYYCTQHYNEMMDTIDYITSYHSCGVENCKKEGTKTWENFYGITEYYCPSHYNELMDALDAFGF